MLWSACAFSVDEFVVKTIRVEGLQRVSRGTVYNYLPIQTGETLSSSETAGIIRALYDTGFFQSVRLEREGNTLVIHILERATIGSINVIGNTEIPSDKNKSILQPSFNDQTFSTNNNSNNNNVVDNANKNVNSSLLEFISIILGVAINIPISNSLIVLLLTS